MKKNVGSIDRGLRIMAAIVCVVLYLTDVVSGILGIVLIVLAVMFVATSCFSWCPLYTPLGLSTLRDK